MTVALPRVGKALCYVIREGELLVFRHRDFPEAGVQVPAGTLRDREDPAVGAIRETEEETGRTGFRIVRKLGVMDHEHHEGERHEIHQRHVFLLDAPAGLPDRWSHLAEAGNGDFWFEFCWLPVGPGLVLAGAQHALLAKI